MSLTEGAPPVYLPKKDAAVYTKHQPYPLPPNFQVPADLELGPPALTKDPLGFMADQLKASFFQEGKGETEEDPYLLRRVIAAIRTAKTVSAHAQSQLDQGLERVSNAQRRLAY